MYINDTHIFHKFNFALTPRSSHCTKTNLMIQPHMFDFLSILFFFGSVLLALAAWIKQNHTQFLWISGAAIIIFRSELAVFLGLILAAEIFSRRLSIGKLLKNVVPAGFLLLGQWSLNGTGTCFIVYLCTCTLYIKCVMIQCGRSHSYLQALILNESNYKFIYSVRKKNSEIVCLLSYCAPARSCFLSVSHIVYL